VINRLLDNSGKPEKNKCPAKITANEAAFKGERPAGKSQVDTVKIAPGHILGRPVTMSKAEIRHSIWSGVLVPGRFLAGM
jgi:hypothetical protein